ncbi:hypothetical protein [Aeromicrobium sp. CTD01-1L150]|uniref:hypothetical protein n=1 Tax=Aeromicrobium sp. CTD01-1L150 TaxID=3341830 RepID=UPI0035BFC269
MTRAVRTSLVALLVLLLAGAAGWAVRPLSPPATPPLTAALSTLPQGSTIVGFTNWRQLSGGPVSFGDLGDRDLASRSDLYGSSAAMDDLLGWSVADLEWEVLAQGGNAGAGVLVAQLDASTSPAAVEEGLADAGFTAADTTDGPRAWENGPTELGAAGLSTVMQHVRVLGRERLVVMSESGPGASAVVDVVRGGATAVTRDRALLDVAGSLAGADAVLLERRGQGCGPTSMTDEESQQQAEVALGSANALEEYVASGRGLLARTGGGTDAQDLTFAMRFADPTTARGQRDVRESVATGPFIGRTGTIEQTLRLESATTDGAVLSLRFGHDPESGIFMTGFGPLLFATC